jgi:hypothetical protein
LVGATLIDIYDELTLFTPGVDATDLTINPDYSAGDDIHLNDAGHLYIFQATRDLVDAAF